MRIFISAILFALLSQNVLARTTIWTNDKTECLKNNTCDLKKFSLTSTADYASFDGNPMQSTSMSAYWETEKKEDLARYGVVQYIKGCLYSQNLTPTKESPVLFNRDFFGKTVRFNHKKWAIDSLDEDPLFGSYLDSQSEMEKRAAPEIMKEMSRWSRHLAMKTTSTGHGDTYLYQSLPQASKLYVTDSPTSSDYSVFRNGSYVSSQITIASMIFKTCLYKIEDIPERSDPEQFDLSKAITCVEWENNWEYNFKAQKFDDKKREIQDFCLN